MGSASDKRKPTGNKPSPGDDNDPLADVKFSGPTPRTDGTQILQDILIASAAAAMSAARRKKPDS